MTSRHKKKHDEGKDGDKKPKHGADGSPRKAFDESMWLRDANGRFAGSVKQSSPLTEQQRIELKDYKDGNYQQLNSYLLAPDKVQPSLAKELDKQIKSIDGAIVKSTLMQDTVVYRGLKHKGLTKHADSLIGKTMNPATFLSTSTDVNVAIDFAGFGEGSVVLAVKAKKGMHAAHMDQFETSGNARENELLFGRDQKIRLTGVDRSRSPMVILGEFE